MKKYILIGLFLFLGTNFINAQCFPDRHSTTWYDAWVSCETSANPNSAHGDSHWIQYDLGFVYDLYQSTIWNINEPESLNNGIENYIIDYSIDGTTWTNLGNFTLNEATGKPIYEGEEGPDFNGVAVRYILITPTSNHGGSCYGLSEVRFNIDENLSIVDKEIGFDVVAYPNPFTDELNIKIKTLLPGEEITYKLYDLLGREIFSKTTENTDSTQIIVINNNDLQLVTGIYFLELEQHNQKQTIKIIKE